MIKNLLNADEQPPEGTKVIIEDTLVGVPPASGNESSTPAENFSEPGTRPAFKIPEDAKVSTRAAENADDTAPLDASTESLEALMADLENLEPEEMDRLESELEAAGLNHPSNVPSSEPISVPAAYAQPGAAPFEPTKTNAVAVEQTTEKAGASESTIFQSDYAPPSTAETIRNSGLAWSAGVVLFGSVIFMMIFGWFADLLLGSSPWGILVGILLGGLIGFIQVFRISSQIFRK